MLREQHRKHFGLRAALRKSRQPIWSYSVEFTHFGQKCEPLYHHLAQSLFDDLLKHSSRPWNHLQLEAVSHCTPWGKFSLEETSEWCTPHCHGHHGNKSSECLPAFILPDLSEALQHRPVPSSETPSCLGLDSSVLSWCSSNVSENSLQVHLHLHALIYWYYPSCAPRSSSLCSHPGDLTPTHA